MSCRDNILREVARAAMPPHAPPDRIEEAMPWLVPVAQVQLPVLVPEAGVHGAPWKLEVANTRLEVPRVCGL